MSATVEEMETESERAAAHYAKIREQEYKCRQLELEVSTAKEVYTDAKDMLKEAVARLRMLIRGGPDEQLELPLEDGTQDDAQTSGDVSLREEAWSRLLAGTRIEDAIPLTKFERERLEDAGVITVQHFEDLRAGKLREYPRGLLSIKRFGPATIDKLEAAIIEWYDSQNPGMAVGASEE